jgi:hypothetical protein
MKYARAAWNLLWAVFAGGAIALVPANGLTGEPSDLGTAPLPPHLKCVGSTNHFQDESQWQDDATDAEPVAEDMLVAEEQQASNDRQAAEAQSDESSESTDLEERYAVTEEESATEDEAAMVRASLQQLPEELSANNTEESAARDATEMEQYGYNDTLENQRPIATDETPGQESRQSRSGASHRELGYDYNYEYARPEDAYDDGYEHARPQAAYGDAYAALPPAERGEQEFHAEAMKAGDLADDQTDDESASDDNSADRTGGLQPSAVAEENHQGCDECEYGYSCANESEKREPGELAEAAEQSGTPTDSDADGYEHSWTHEKYGNAVDASGQATEQATEETGNEDSDGSMPMDKFGNEADHSESGQWKDSSHATPAESGNDQGESQMRSESTDAVMPNGANLNQGRNGGTDTDDAASEDTASEDERSIGNEMFAGLPGKPSIRPDQAILTETAGQNDDDMVSEPGDDRWEVGDRTAQEYTISSGMVSVASAMRDRLLATVRAWIAAATSLDWQALPDRGEQAAAALSDRMTDDGPLDR